MLLTTFQITFSHVSAFSCFVTKPNCNVKFVILCDAELFRSVEVNTLLIRKT